MRTTVDGLVLREAASGESDKLLTVLTAEHGRILISAKGARSMKSKNLALCSLYTYANFECYEKNGMRWLAGGSVNRRFCPAGTELEALALAAYVVDIAAEISDEGVNADELLRVTMNTLYAIENKIKPYDIIKGAYEIYAAFSSGFTPDVTCCRKCGTPRAETMYLDVMNGSLICSGCLGESAKGQTEAPDTDAYMARNILLPMSEALTAALRYLSGAQPSRMLAFELKEERDIADLSRLGEIYLQNHLERGFDTLEFYKKVK